MGFVSLMFLAWVWFMLDLSLVCLVSCFGMSCLLCVSCGGFGLTAYGLGMRVALSVGYYVLLSLSLFYCYYFDDMLCWVSISSGWWLLLLCLWVAWLWVCVCGFLGVFAFDYDDGYYSWLTLLFSF